MAATVSTFFQECQGVVKTQWEIPQYLDLPAKVASLSSPEFYLSDATWKIVCYPYPTYAANELYFELVKGSKFRQYPVSVSIKIEAGGSVLEEKVNTQTMGKIKNEYIHFKYFCERSKIINSLQHSLSGSVSFFCTARLLEKSSDFSSQTSTDLQPQTLLSVATQTSVNLLSHIACHKEDFEKLSEDFENLFLDGHNTDLKLKVRGEVFSAHKSVLIARSSVFSAMFQHEMTENKTGVIEINDVDPEFFRDFLLFIYSGKFDSVSDKNSAELYKVANEYDLIGLKEECSKRMKANLSSEIILDVLLIASSYEDDSLSEFATEFFIENAEAIFKTNEWKTFFLKKENSDLAQELMLKVVRKHERR